MSSLRDRGEDAPSFLLSSGLFEVNGAARALRSPARAPYSGSSFVLIRRLKLSSCHPQVFLSVL